MTSGKVQAVVKPESSDAVAVSGVFQRKCDCGQHTIAGGECSSCSKESELPLQRSAVNSPESHRSGIVPPIVHDVLNSPGRPLDANTRAFFEPRFGHDFSGVRVHSDTRAAESAHAVNALAYTVGREVVFGAGQYAPGVTKGRQLLAHELAHVIQQGGQSVELSTKLDLGSDDGPLEREADRAADVLEQNEPHLGSFKGLKISRGTSPLIQRAVRFKSKIPLAIDKWDAATTSINGRQAVITDGDFAASATIRAEADSAGEFNNWEVGFLQNAKVTWSRTYWNRANDDKRGKFLERKLKVPATPLRDHLNDAIVWAAPGEFADIATAAGAALSADIPISTSDGPDSKRSIDGSGQAGGDASEGTDNIYQFRHGFNFTSFVSAHNKVTDEWRHIELTYWSVQSSVDFAPKPGGGVSITKDDRSLGKSRRFAWTPAADQPAIGGTLTNTYINNPANTSVKRVEGWT